MCRHRCLPRVLTDSCIYQKKDQIQKNEKGMMCMYKSKGYRKNRADYQVCADDGTMYPSWPYLYPDASIQQWSPWWSPWRPGWQQPGWQQPGWQQWGQQWGRQPGWQQPWGRQPGWQQPWGQRPGGMYPGQRQLLSPDQFDQATLPPDYDDID
jgi:hypothetical protein